MSSCVESSRNLSQICQTDITFPDCTSKYLPLEKVYFHILEKIHEAFFDLQTWDCSFDKDVTNKHGDTQRDTIIRRACKRPPSTEDTHVNVEENHVAMPAKVAKEDHIVQKLANTSALQDVAECASLLPPTSPKSEPTTQRTSDVSTSPSIFAAQDRNLTTSPTKPSTPLIATVSSPFTSPTSSEHDNRGITSPIVNGIIGVLCPSSIAGVPKKSENSPFDLSQFNPFLAPTLGDGKKLENVQLDELRTLRLALSSALQQTTDNSDLANLTKSILATPPTTTAKLQPSLFQPELNLADFMLHNNLFKLPQLSPAPKKNTIIPAEYQLLDDSGSSPPKSEVLSPTNDSKQKLHQCPYCEARFNQKSNLKTHVFGVHQFKLSTCRTCKIITSKEKLKEHMKTHPNRGFRCHQCDTSFDTHIRLLRHMKIHSSERPYKCSFCPKSFVYKWNLTEHVRIHTGEKPFVCRLCGKGFCQSSTLKRHSLAMHTTEKPYKCSQCEESFVRILLLKKHFVNHHMGPGSTNTVPVRPAPPLHPLNAPPPHSLSTPLPDPSSLPPATSQQHPPDALSMLHMFSGSTGNQF